MVKTYGINCQGYALRIECETYEQAEQCAADIGGEVIGELVFEGEWMEVDDES